MRYGSSSSAAYFKTRNLSPQVAAIYRANQSRNELNNRPARIREDDYFEFWKYDNINGKWFPKRGTIQELHPEAAAFITSLANKKLQVFSKVVINLACPKGHKWKSVAKDFITQHRNAITKKEKTCVQCQAAAVQRAENKSIAQVKRTKRVTITDNQERYFYIHKVTNAEGKIIAYKYGITIDIYSRLEQQRRCMESGLSMTTVHTFKSTSKEVCIIESRIKQFLSRESIQPALTKAQLADGWTETVCADKLSLEMLLEIANV